MRLSKEYKNYLPEEWFHKRHMTGGQKCSICNVWIKLPRKRKYSVPTIWTKCEKCKMGNEMPVEKNIHLYEHKPTSTEGFEMKWIDVEKELPSSKKRFLAKCVNSDKDSSWTGVVDVLFDPHRGWIRSEPNNQNAVYVTHYTDHPYLIEEQIKYPVTRTEKI